MRWIVLLLVCVLGFPSPARAAQPIDAIDSPAAAHPVWVLPDDRTNVIAMTAVFAGGISMDPAGKEGVMNLLGDLMLAGAGTRDAASLTRFLKDHGIAVSISSTRDETILSVSAPSRHWPQAQEVLRDIITDPRFDTDEITRAVAAQTASIRSDRGDAGWRAQRLLNATVFNGSPYARPGAGTPESLAELNRQDFMAMHAKLFAAKPEHIVFVGDIADVEGMGENCVDNMVILCGLNQLFAHKGTSLEPPPHDNRRSTEAPIFHQFDVPQTNLLIAFAGLAPSDPDFAALAVLDALLADGFGSRLMEALRAQSGLSYGIHSGLQDARHGPLWVFSVQVASDKAQEAASIIEREVQRAATEAFDKKEVATARESLAARLPMGWTSSPAIAAQLSTAQRQGFDVTYLQDWQRRLRAVTPQAITKAARRVTGAIKPVTIAVGRQSPGADWSARPELP